MTDVNLINPVLIASIEEIKYKRQRDHLISLLSKGFKVTESEINDAKTTDDISYDIFNSIISKNYKYKGIDINKILDDARFMYYNEDYHYKKLLLGLLDKVSDNIKISKDIDLLIHRLE